MASQQHSTYYPLFDFLRITLAITVVLAHDYIFVESVNMWKHSGNFAVQVFFALSGFLIGSILIKTPKEKLSRFYFNRSVRIWIPYFIALSFVVIAGLLHDPITDKWIEFVIYKINFVYNIFGPPQLAAYRDAMPLQGSSNHFWSVNAEEQFYLIAPLFLVIANKHWGQHFLTWVLIVIIALITNTYASIALGVLSVVLVKHYGKYYQKQLIKLMLIVCLVVSAYVLFLDLAYDLAAPMCAISIVLLLAIEGKQNSVGAFLGGISYPLYLNHWIGVFTANIFLKRFDLHTSMTRVIIEIILNLAIASLLFLMIEKPILAKRNALFTDNRGILACSVAYMMIFIGIAYGIYSTR